MCLLFKQQTIGTPAPRTFIPSNLQPVVDICVHGPEDKRELGHIFALD